MQHIVKNLGLFLRRTNKRCQTQTWWGSSVAVVTEKPLPIGVLPIDPRRRQGKRSGMVDYEGFDLVRSGFSLIW